MAEADVLALETVVQGEVVPVSLHQPTAPARGRRTAPPAVVIADACIVEDEACSRLLEALAAGLLGADLAVARLAAPAFLSADLYVDATVAACRAVMAHEAVDGSRTGLLGYSMGGLFASCAARRVEPLRQVCLLAPTTSEDVLGRLSRVNGDLPRLDRRWTAKGFLESVQKLAPTRDLSFHDRPTLIVHGAADTVVPPEVSRAYLANMDLVEHRVEDLLIARGDHALTNAAMAALAVQHVVGYFEGLKTSPELTAEAGAPAS